MPVITFTDFSYAYSGTEKVLDQICLEIPQGSFTVIAGPSGAGKTTLCHAIAGAVPHFFGGALAGRVEVKGISIMESSMADLARVVGTVFEDYESQLVNMTVGEEVSFGLENAGLAVSDIRKTVSEVLQRVGLSGMESREVAGLSGGQKQRLAIASVLALKPEILVLDEPASAMDPEGKEELYQLLDQLNHEQHMTIVVVEHDIEQVLLYASQLVLLRKGKVLLAGAPVKVLYEAGRNPELEPFLPAFLEMKMQLEREYSVQFAEWLSADDVVRDLSELLRANRAEVSRSA